MSSCFFPSFHLCFIHSHLATPLIKAYLVLYLISLSKPETPLIIFMHLEYICTYQLQKVHQTPYYTLLFFKLSFTSTNWIAHFCMVTPSIQSYLFTHSSLSTQASHTFLSPLQRSRATSPSVARHATTASFASWVPKWKSLWTRHDGQRRMWMPFAVPSGRWVISVNWVWSNQMIFLPLLGYWLIFMLLILLVWRSNKYRLPFWKERE